MKIMALWDRPIADIRYGDTFCLTDDGQLLTVNHDREFEGTDKTGKRIYRETGMPEWFHAFNDNDKFDFEKADYWLRHFGGVLIKKF